jgi:hypothetical protein
MRDIASRHGCGSWAPKWQLDHQLALLRTFFETHGAPPQSWKGFGVSIVARVEDKRGYHERAGRGGSLSWLRNGIECSGRFG